MDSVMQYISIISVALSIAAIIISIFTFYKFHKLKRDIAVTTHLNRYKQAVKQIWTESKPVIMAINQILGDELVKIGRKTDKIQSIKSKYYDSRPLHHHFYELHEHCVEEIEPLFTKDNFYRSEQKIISLLNVVYENDIKRFLDTGKPIKLNTFSAIKTREGAKNYHILNSVDQDELRKINTLITDKITEAFCIYTLNKEKIDNWLDQLATLKTESKFERFSIEENSRLNERLNVMLNTLQFLTSNELRYLVENRNEDYFNTSGLLHSAVMMNVFGKLAKKYIS